MSACPEVIVVGAAEDPHALRVATALGDRGVDVLLLDLEPYPALLPLSLADGAPTYRGLDLRGARAAYVRSVHMRLPFFDLDVAARAGVPAETLVARWQAGYGAERERQSFLCSFLLALERAGVTVVNPTATLDQHFAKLDQLAILRAAGVPVPRTLGTNDPEAVRRFVAEVGQAVVKPLAGGGLCRRVTGADLASPEALLALAGGGALFQAEAPGRNVRAYVVGGRTVAAYEIESEALDYRGSETAVRRLDPVPPQIAEVSERAAAACGMSFTGADLRWDRSGEGPTGATGAGSLAVLLELNPSPMFAGIEKWTGAAPVTEALCALLERTPRPW